MENEKALYLGSCVDSFDRDGECLQEELGWSSVSDFACAEENAQEVEAEEFQSYIPIDIVNLTTGHKVKYLMTEDNILMLYDLEDDVHYFFLNPTMECVQTPSAYTKI